MLTATKRTIRLRPRRTCVVGPGRASRSTTLSHALQAIDAGLTAIAGGAARDADTREIAEEVGTIAARLIELERVLDRNLFVACAAYAYARNAALARDRAMRPSPPKRARPSNASGDWRRRHGHDRRL
jgi:ABC-type enterochelin transport system ATPase subunit